MQRRLIAGGAVIETCSVGRAAWNYGLHVLSVGAEFWNGKWSQIGGSLSVPESISHSMITNSAVIMVCEIGFGTKSNPHIWDHPFCTN